MQVVGQSRLLSYIDTIKLDTLPRTLLLVGDYGSGKHMFCNYIASRLNLQVENISDKLTLETINNISQRVILSLYVIESDKISVREENVILKFLEEPPSSAFIVILCENENYLIETVRNRCYKLKLSAYTQEELSRFLLSADDDSILNIATTPGQVIEMRDQPIQEMKALAVKIFTCIASANLANVLTISNKLAYKNEQDKFNYKIFYRVLHNTITQLVLQHNDNKLYGVYYLTNSLCNDQLIANIDQRRLFENYLCKLQKYLRESTSRT